jgi:GNAT superfamily N-acetyltransferase
MKPVDDKPVWSVICFVVPAEYRGQGVAGALLAGAVAYAKKCGARLIEAYPVDKPRRSHDDFMWFGAKSMYDKAGFSEWRAGNRIGLSFASSQSEVCPLPLAMERQVTGS